MTDVHQDVFAHRPPEADEIPLVVSVPHTGVLIPDEMTARLASDEMRSLPMTDWHLHHLYDFVPSLGADLLCAQYSRFVVDLNRPPTPRALYPGRFETGLVALETFKGEASYYSLTGTDELLENVVWWYPTPMEEVAGIAEHAAFYADRVRIELVD